MPTLENKKTVGENEEKREGQQNLRDAETAEREMSNRNSKLLVYWRRPRETKNKTLSLLYTVSHQLLKEVFIPHNSTLLNPNNTTLVFNTALDIPITIWKGVRNSTKHPLSNYLSYHRWTAIARPSPLIKPWVQFPKIRKSTCWS